MDDRMKMDFGNQACAIVSFQDDSRQFDSRFKITNPDQDQKKILKSITQKPSS